MKHILLASVAIAAISAFSDTVETVIVKMGDAEVRINKSEYDAHPDDYTLVKKATENQPAAVAGVQVGLPEGIIVPPAPSAPNFAPAAGEPQPPAAGPVPPTAPSPGSKLIMKNPKGKFIVVEGVDPFNPVKGVDGIDEKGYDTQEAAQDAIAALPHD